MKTKNLAPILVALWGAFIAVTLWRRFLAPKPALLPVVKLAMGSNTWAEPATQVEAACEYATRAGCIVEIEIDFVRMRIGPGDEPLRIMTMFHRERAEREEQERANVFAGAGPGVPAPEPAPGEPAPAPVA